MISRTRTAALAVLLLAAACDRAPTAADPAELGPADAPAFLLSGDTLMWTDFSGYPAGAQPAGWTQMWDPTPHFLVGDEAPATGGRVLRWSATGQSRNRWALAYDGLGPRTDQSVYTEFRVRSLGGGASVYYMGSAAVRISGTAADERGYAVFFVAVPSTGAKAVVLSTWTGGAYTQLGSYTCDWQMDTWYAVRLEAVGTTIRARFWPRGTAEPAAWQLSAIDSRHPSGRPGVSHHDNGTVEWDVWRAVAPSQVAGFATQFAAGPAWVAPAGWTETSAPENASWTVAADPTVQDGRALRNVTTFTGRHILRLDAAADTATDQEVLVKLRMADGDDRGPGVALRHSMSGIYGTAYVAYLRPGIDQVEINRFLNGGWSFVGNAPFPNDPGAWYWMRFRAQGTQVMVRVWADGQPEPAAWTRVASDAGIASGTAGLYAYEPNTVDYDLFAYASGGAAAVPPPPGAAPVTTGLSTSPASATVVTNEAVQLRAHGLLASGDTFPVAAAWTATGGTVTPSGLFTSTTSGTFHVTASALGHADTTRVLVLRPPVPGATTFTTRFTGTAGTLPAGWSASSAPANVTWRLAAAAGATDGAVMRAVSTLTARHILRLDALPEGPDQEALTLFRMADDDARGPGLAVRHSMNGTSETAYVAYLGSVPNVLEVNRFLNGAWKYVAAVSFVSDPGEWYWMRFRAQGTTLAVRVWRRADVEPLAWNLVASDDGIAWGRTGLYVYEPNTVDFDAFSAANGAGSAPQP